MPQPSQALTPHTGLYPGPYTLPPPPVTNPTKLPHRPHFSFPFTRTATGVQTVEQGSQEHIMACEQVIAYCPLGYREDRPEFGWSWPDLPLVPVDATPLLNALNTFEPRANATLARAQELAAGVFEIDVSVGIPVGDLTGASQGVD